MVPSIASRRLTWPSRLFMPGGRIRVFEVRHEHAGAGVQRIDDHLAVDRAGDLHAAVEQVLRDGRDRPFRFADVGGFGEETGQMRRRRSPSGGSARRSRSSLAARFKLACQFGQETGLLLESGFAVSNVIAEVAVVAMSVIVHLVPASRTRLTGTKRTTWPNRTTRFGLLRANGFYCNQTGTDRHRRLQTCSTQDTPDDKQWNTDPRWKGIKRPYSSHKMSPSCAARSRSSTLWLAWARSGSGGCCITNRTCPLSARSPATRRCSRCRPA